MDEDSCNGNQNTAPAPKATSHSKHKQHKLMAHTATQTQHQNQENIEQRKDRNGMTNISVTNKLGESNGDRRSFG